MKKRYLILILIVLFNYMPSVLAARNVTCRAMNQSGKIIGIYTHTAADFPTCECSNPDIPEKLKKDCAKSLRAV